MKKGLVLEGGAMRGMFTSGVLDVFMENGIDFDGAIGVSAGATFGCNYKSRQPGRAIRYNKRFSHDWRYCSFRSLFLTGDMYGADFCYNQIPNRLDIYDVETYRKNPMQFYIVASDAVSGKSVYKKLETCDAHDLMWMRASASMPLVSKPVKIDGFCAAAFYGKHRLRPECCYSYAAARFCKKACRRYAAYKNYAEKISASCRGDG